MVFFSNLMHILDIGQSRKYRVSELVSLLEVISVQHESTLFLGLGLLKFCASIVNCGQGFQARNGWVDAELLPRRKRYLLDHFCG